MQHKVPNLLVGGGMHSGAPLKVSFNSSIRCAILASFSELVESVSLFLRKLGGTVVPGASVPA